VASDYEEFDPRFDPAFQRGYDGPAIAAGPPRPEPAGEGAESPSAAHRDQLESAIVVQLTQPSLKGNPWVIVLWALGAGLTLAGITGSWQSQARLVNRAASAADYYVIPTVIQTLSPWAFAVGLAVIAAVAVLHATRWRP
jgi:hypothetical protein